MQYWGYRKNISENITKPIKIKRMWEQNKYFAFTSRHFVQLVTFPSSVLDTSDFSPYILQLYFASAKEGKLQKNGDFFEENNVLTHLRFTEPDSFKRDHHRDSFWNWFVSSLAKPNQQFSTFSRRFLCLVFQLERVI